MSFPDTPAKPPGRPFRALAGSPEPSRTESRDLPVRRHSFTRLSRSELAITETELKLMAAAATIGDSRIPKNG